jgi:hypothetical protein
MSALGQATGGVLPDVTEPRRALAAGGAATLLAGAVAALATGVDAWELVRYGLYLAGFVLVPGVAVYLALMPRPGDPVRVLALAWALGLALVLAAFALTAALGIRAALWLYPVVALGLAFRPALRHAGAIAWGETPPPRAVAAGTSVIVLAFAYLALGPFAASPLPDGATSVEYAIDNVFDISLVAEAMHHWPMASASVAGEPLRYHVFAFLDMAATANVTGVEASTLVLRLFPLALTVLVVLLMVCLGRRLTGVWAIGVLAAALLFLTGELDLSPRDELPFAGTFARSTWESPTFLFAMPFFLAAVLVVCDVLARRGRPARPEWIYLALMTAAATGAKVSAVPVLIGGLVLTAGWCLLRDRSQFRPLVKLTAALGAIFLAGYVALYTGGSGALELRPWAFLEVTVPGQRSALVRDNFLIGALVSGPAIVAGWFALAGLAWMLWPPRLRQVELFLLALFAASLVPTLVISGTGASQLYFLLYGVPPAIVLAAAGLGRFWAARDLRPARFAAAAAGGLVVAGVGAAWAWGYGDDAVLPVLVVYAAVSAVVVAAALALAPGWRATVPVAVALLVAISLADRPIDIVAVNGTPTDRPEARGTTRALTDGLRWVREETDEDALLAVNVHHRDAAGSDSRYFYYSALAERRVFLESWNYTPQGADEDVAQPYADRLAINDGALLDGNPDDLEELRRLGVDYVLIDRLHGDGSPALDDAARRVFSNDALVVYRL